MMAHEYWLVGECFPFLIWDDVNDPQTFESWKLINPLNIELQKSFMTDGRPDEVIKLKIDETTKTIISNGPNHAKTGILYNRMPREWIDACTKGDGTLNLNHEQISHFKRKEGNYFDPAGRGEQHKEINGTLLSAVFLLLLKPLRSAVRQVCARGECQDHIPVLIQQRSYILL
jgi:hypothetical protein